LEFKSAAAAAGGICTLLAHFSQTNIRLTQNIQYLPGNNALGSMPAAINYKIIDYHSG
jgi:hypothetical protein